MGLYASTRILRFGVVVLHTENQEHFIAKLLILVLTQKQVLNYTQGTKATSVGVGRTQNSDALAMFLRT